MKFQGALIKEQGITFGIAIVKSSILNSTNRDQIRLQFSRLFGAPTVLMAQDSWGTPKFYGRQDIVNFLAKVPIEFIPWSEFHLQ